jgi:hypothetical protein
MRENIAELTELMEAYRRRSKAVPSRPIAEAYAEAAGDLEDILAARKVEKGPTSSHRI